MTTGAADPNQDRNDPMVAEYWALGEALQDAIREAGHEHPSVEGIAVDIHDLLQAADTVRSVLESEAPLREKLDVLRFELSHMKWHCEAGLAYLEAARQAAESGADSLT